MQNHAVMLDYLKDAMRHRPHKACMLILEIRGRQIRLEGFPKEHKLLKFQPGDDLEIYTNPNYTPSDKRIGCFTFNISKELEKGDMLYFSQGNISANVTMVSAATVLNMILSLQGVVKVKFRDEGFVSEFSELFLDKNLNLPPITD